MDPIGLKNDMEPDLSGTIANLETDFQWMRLEDRILPVTVNSGDSRTCYIVCPTTAYIDYARDELRNFSRLRLMRVLLGGLITAMTPLVRATGFDRQFQLNDWLLATNIWCGFDRDGIETLTAELLAKYPLHALVWRSLNDVSDSHVLDYFSQAGYGLYPARQVYLYDCRAALPAKGRDLKRDMRLLEEATYIYVKPEDFAVEDSERIVELYGMLYLEKYTYLNPQYTPRFIDLVRDGGILEFHGLRDRTGVLAGVVGIFQKGDVMTAPIVGYDTSQPRSHGLYRQLMAITLMKARGQRLLYNMSAGAAGFKRARGAVPAIEYNAIYNRHLSLSSRVAAWIMRTILTRVGVPIMRSQQL